MSPEEWLRNQKLGWCRANTWMTLEACNKRRSKQLVGYRGLGDATSGPLVGCDNCAGLDMTRQRDNSPDPRPLPAEPLPKSIVISPEVVMAGTKKSPKLCVVEGCSSYRQHGCDKMCKAHFNEKQLAAAPVVGQTEPLDIASAVETSAQMGAALERLENAADPGGASAVAADPCERLEQISGGICDNCGVFPCICFAVGAGDDADGIADFLRGFGPEGLNSALSGQVGGDHYRKLGEYQPWQVLQRWLTADELRGFAKGTAIVYCARERDKGGDEDIRKAIHTLQIYLELAGGVQP